MKKILFLILFVFLLGIVSPKILAAETSSKTDPLDKIEYSPRLLPTSPFYFLKQWKEKVELVLARTPEKKVAKRLEIANRRLAELKAVVGKKPELAQELADRYEEQLGKLEEEAQTLEEKKRRELLEHVEEVTLKHQEVLLDVYQKVPEPAKRGIETALEKSLRGYQVIEKIKERKEEGKERVNENKSRRLEKRKERIMRRLEKAEEKFKGDPEAEKRLQQIKVRLEKQMEKPTPHRVRSQIKEGLKERVRPRVKKIREVDKGDDLKMKSNKEGIEKENLLKKKAEFDH
jgi:hypothetical protein